MNRGHYFAIETYGTAKAPTSYKYLKIIQKQAPNAANAEDPHLELNYPILLSLDKDSISFSVAGWEHIRNKDQAEDQTTTVFLSNLLFRISLDDLDGASKQIVSLFSYEQDSGVFYTHNSNYERNTSPIFVDAAWSKAYYKSIKDQSSNGLSRLISSLFPGLQHQGWNQQLRNFLIPENKQTEPGRLIYFCELFMDFLYDFYYTSLFYTHPHYAEIEGKLEQNKLIRAIIGKLRFHYSAHQVAIQQKEEPANTKIFSDDFLPENFHNVNLADEKEQAFADSFVEEGADNIKNWLSILRENGAERTVNVKNKCFKNIEAEHRAVYKIETEAQQAFSKTLSKEAEDSLQWLIGRYNIWGGMMLQFFYIFNIWSRIAFGFGAISTLYIGYVLYFSNDKDLYYPEAFTVFYGISLLGLGLVAGVIAERLFVFTLKVIQIFEGLLRIRTRFYSE